MKNAPYHAHIYFDHANRAAAEGLHAAFDRLRGEGSVIYVGALRDGAVGPHPVPQFEIHFTESDLDALLPLIRTSGLRALVHPLTDDDLADHTSLATWIGEPLLLDLSVLDPPGLNQGVARFGKSDF